jgi:2'-5' RNA ligase
VSNPPSPKLRLFLAVRAEPTALEALERVVAPVRVTPPGDRLRWTETEKLHVTLRFFGSVSKEAPDVIGEVCREVCASTAAFSMRLAGAGAFPNARRASVLWIGVSEGGAELRTLAEALNPRLDALSLAREERDYTPHLTIARSKQPLQLRAAVTALSTVSIPTRVDALLLVRSVLGSPAARYEVLDRYPLSRT